MAAGAAVISAPAAQASGYCYVGGQICFWADDTYQGDSIYMSWDVYEWGQSNFHDRATSVDSDMSRRYYVYDDPFYTGANTYIGPYSQFSDLGPSWAGGWSDRIDSSRFA
ncbi:peptidase inhibitor family I36 protein [Arthrobacter alpinus]|uniref:peptidase inhibitor family I36 protein n=1 Tax=Arthrobacter alpinus TaxID=656366 RepID=UPI00164844BD